MGIKTIKKSIEIMAPREQVWTVLLDHEYFRDWSSAFAPGSTVETDWQLGGKVTFLDGQGHGMMGRVISLRPAEQITMEYDGIVADGKEDYDSDFAKATKGSRESYYLTENAGVTRLAIESDMTEEYFDVISAAWDEALQRVKALSEDMSAHPEKMRARSMGHDVAGING